MKVAMKAAQPALTNRKTVNVSKSTAVSRTRVACIKCEQKNEMPRRMALALPLLAGLVMAREAQAGGAPKNTSVASMSSYTLEGTKKMGASPKRKSAVIESLKEKIASGELS